MKLKLLTIAFFFTLSTFAQTNWLPFWFFSGLYSKSTERKPITLEENYNGHIVYNNELFKSNFEIKKDSIYWENNKYSLFDKNIYEIKLTDKNNKQLKINRFKCNHNLLGRVLTDTLGLKIFDLRISEFNNQNINKKGLKIEYQGKKYNVRNYFPRKKNKSIYLTIKNIPFKNVTEKEYLENWLNETI